MWIRMGTCGERLWSWKWAYGFHRRRETSWLAEWLLASQELCYLEMARTFVTVLVYVSQCCITPCPTPPLAQGCSILNEAAGLQQSLGPHHHHEYWFCVPSNFCYFIGPDYARAHHLAPRHLAPCLVLQLCARSKLINKCIQCDGYWIPCHSFL
jgi:hypothetical protein